MESRILQNQVYKFKINIAQIPPYMCSLKKNRLRDKARSAVWKDTGGNEKGRVTEEILLDTDVVLLNNGPVTHYHSQTNSYSVTDLTLCSADCQVYFVHTVLEDLYDGDHYPIHVELTNNIPSK